MYCLLSSANRKGWDLLGVRQGGAGEEVEKIRSIISNAVRGGENSSQEGNPRGEQLWGSTGALAAKEAACGHVSAAFRASMGTGEHGHAAR